jgi:glycosyltransferase involved in cell wall biosynthesis
MITFVCSSREPKESFKEHIIKMCGLDKKKVEFLAYKNENEYSLSEIYNKGLKEAKNDIIVFLHDDLIIESSQFGKKLVKHFEKNPEYGIIGLAGTRELSSGRWWDNSRTMMGIVNHKHEGKKWESKYSNDIGNNINEAVVLDGVFFAIDRLRLKEDFDERFKGFHLYDISFCFRNFLTGVKLGVITNIRVTHLSIGMTNDQWEENKKLFEETYGSYLPAKVKKVLHKGEKLKVLIGCLSFKEFTGSEVHVLELAKELVNQNCDVTICSQIGGEISKIANSYGIKLANISEPPHFKLGDGKWQINTQEGLQPSQNGVLYPISKVDFDVLHLMHKPVTEHLLKCYPGIETICTIHSEVIDLENPVINSQIKKYIAIRPEIKDYMVKEFNIASDIIDIIYNPVDSNKFKVKVLPKRNFKRVLFVGTIDYLRKDMILDLIETTKNDGNELWIVGKKNSDYLDEVIKGKNHVKYFQPTWNIEEYIHQCDETAGILLGRTTIESWMCGKPAWIYNVDKTGNVLSKELYQVPEDIDKFKGDYVAKITIEKYKEILD